MTLHTNPTTKFDLSNVMNVQQMYSLPSSDYPPSEEWLEYYEAEERSRLYNENIKDINTIKLLLIIAVVSIIGAFALLYQTPSLRTWFPNVGIILFNSYLLIKLLRDYKDVQDIQLDIIIESL